MFHRVRGSPTFQSCRQKARLTIRPDHPVGHNHEMYDGAPIIFSTYRCTRTIQHMPPVCLGSYVELFSEDQSHASSVYNSCTNLQSKIRFICSASREFIHSFHFLLIMAVAMPSWAIWGMAQLLVLQWPLWVAPGFDMHPLFA